MEIATKCLKKRSVWQSGQVAAGAIQMLGGGAGGRIWSVVTGVPRLLRPDEAARLLYEGLPTPICLLDAQGRLVGMNPSAERFWDLRLFEAGGRPALEVLGLRPVSGPGDNTAWWHTAAASDGIVPCTVCDTGTGDRPLSLRVTSLATLAAADPPHFLLSVVMNEWPHSDGASAAWVWSDPVTGLGNRAWYERVRGRWERTGGAVAFLDLDDLKGLNDLYGHLAGDQALSLMGEVLRELLPAGSLAVRYGGDEFLVLAADAPSAEGLVRQAEAELLRRGRETLPLAPGMSWGVAPFDPGGLEPALRAADDALYERKGVLFRAASGGRLVLTRAGQRLLEHDIERGGFLRRSRGLVELLCGGGDAAVAEARSFVAFVAPPSGGAVVEVGAGDGRLTIDGGLAAAIGPRGQLLVTDPVESRLQAGQRHATTRGHAWIRYLQSAAEDLPLASGTADLVVGGLFLHRADPGRALAEMARLVRSGGRVAFSAVLPFVWPDAWRGLWPRLGGSPEALRDSDRVATESRVRALVSAAGLEVERAEVRSQAMEPVETVAAALEVLRRLGQAGIPGVPFRGRRAQPAVGPADDGPLPPQARRLRSRLLYLVARKVSAAAAAT